MPIDREKLAEYFMERKANPMNWDKVDFTEAIATFERLSELLISRRKIHGCQCASCQMDY